MNNEAETIRPTENGQDNAVDKLLIWAVENGHADVAEIFLERKANPNAADEDEHPRFDIGDKKWTGQYCGIVVKHNANPDITDNDGSPALIKAVFNKDIVELLLKYNAHPNAANERTYDDNTALMWAAHWGRGDIVELLLKYNAHPDVASNEGCTDLIRAALESQLGAGYVEALIGYYGDLDTAHNKKYQIFSDSGHPAFRDGYTALMLATYENHVHVVELLLEHNANPDTENYYGTTALMLAIDLMLETDWGVDIIKLLLKHNADPNVANCDGDTALMEVAKYGKSDIMELLLKHNANPDMANNSGDTALMLAASRGQTDTAKMLLDNGANSDVVSKNNKTALDIAIEEGHTEIAEMLRNRLAS